MKDAGKLKRREDQSLKRWATKPSRIISAAGNYRRRTLARARAEAKACILCLAQLALHKLRCSGLQVFCKASLPALLNAAASSFVGYGGVPRQCRRRKHLCFLHYSTAWAALVFLSEGSPTPCISNPEPPILHWHDCNRRLTASAHITATGCLVPPVPLHASSP